MKRIIFVFFCFFFFASASTGEDWEGKKILVDEREKVISACEKGILSKGRFRNECGYPQDIVVLKDSHHAVSALG